MPGYPMPMSGGQPQPQTTPFAMSQPKAGGDINISRAEAVALRAFDTDEDENRALTRARAESGLTHDQIKVLRSRADKARSGGYTLKGPGITFKPKQDAVGEEPGLLGKSDFEKKPAGAKGAKAPKGKEADSRMTRKDDKDDKISSAYKKMYKPMKPTRESAILRECKGDMNCPCRAHRRAKESRIRRRFHERYAR
jgi:hypothetical protein